MVYLSRESMEASFIQYLKIIFELPEIISATVKKIPISRETIGDAGKRAFDAGFHDCFSDIDLSVKVRLPSDGSVTPDQYMKRIDRFGVNSTTALGWCFIPENKIYRIIFRNGMRYDFGFEFEYDGNVTLDPGELPDADEKNDSWPMEHINRFWFIQIQALAKLYRKDYLISSHLANVNCNETLVMQMVLRDLKYGTNFHRYGYSEDLEYVGNLGKSPYRTGDQTFDRIADHLYAAALSCDKLAKEFYPHYQNRSDNFFAIWDCYETFRRSV